MLLPYKTRDWKSNIPYHIMSRSNWKERLFREEEDFQYFFHLLEQTSHKYPFQLNSFIFMQTHFHMLIKSDNLHYSHIMYTVKKQYAEYYNRKYTLRGHLFDKRFIVKPAYSQRTILIMSRYIHYNPVEINLVRKPEDYKWSSYPLLLKADLNVEKDLHLPSFIDFKPLLNPFKGTNNEKRKKYIQWCSKAY